MKIIVFIFCVLEYLLCGNLGSELQDISPEEITLFVYTQTQPDGTEVHLTDANQITKISPFDTKLKTIFYVHGWRESVHKESWLSVTKAVLNSENINVITISWDSCANNIDYFASVRCVPYVGTYVGEFIKTIAETYTYSFSDVTVVGHSLGAHIAGFIGKNTNGSLAVIVGLDPAGPDYHEDQPETRLTETDAKYVQGIHTNTILLGVNYNVGHADYWPNGGYVQKGCELDPNCSHLRAWLFYAESIKNNTFYARQCDGYINFGDKKCSQNFKTLMAGLDVDTTAIGDFYLNTYAESPYGMGDVV